MKQEEKWVEEYLASQGIQDIVFEPDGKVSPDFLVSGEHGVIAIEVRRLNQYYETEPGKLEALETLAEPLLRRLDTLLKKLGPPESGVSWRVVCSFKRPQLTKNWEVVVREKLKAFGSATAQGAGETIEIDGNFKLRLARRGKAGHFAFDLGGDSDHDAGGWFIPEQEKSLNFCVEEKTRKLEPHRSKYQEWWLILVDFLPGGLVEEAAQVKVKHGWNKILVLPPGPCARAYEIKSLV